MIINFSWGSGQMSVDAETLILDMPTSQYRKWVKLFAKHGEPADQEAFLQRLEDFSANLKQDAEPLKAELADLQAKATGRVFTWMSQDYIAKEMKRIQRHLNGISTKLKRHRTMGDLLKGCLS